MDFFDLTSHFFHQLSNGIAIEQKTITFDYKDQEISIPLENQLVKILSQKYDIDYPFVPEVYIKKIDQLRKIEDKSINEAIQTIHDIKIIRWSGNSLLIPKEIERLFEDELKNLSIYEKVIYQELIEAKLSFKTKYKLKRNRIYNDLINLIDTRTHQISFPDPYIEAMLYHKEKGSKYIKWKEDIIAPVMEKTKIYIQDKPHLKTIYGHVKPIQDKCNDLKGGKDAKRNWIKHYANKVGLEIEKN